MFHAMEKEEARKGTSSSIFSGAEKLEGNKIAFTTGTVDNRWFDFKGTVERGAGKKPGDEAYYLLKGTLTENMVDAAKKVTTRSQNVAFNMFPGEAGN